MNILRQKQMYNVVETVATFGDEQGKGGRNKNNDCIIRMKLIISHGVYSIDSLWYFILILRLYL
ncbi:MAG: hypothetical protein DSY43_01885 [Gammaproteobacteria bacterium]|nr:MAG: hypothetical protein DSY43_01885 [Gammaproteobacteria bacterium]